MKNIIKLILSFCLLFLFFINSFAINNIELLQEKKEIIIKNMPLKHKKLL